MKKPAQRATRIVHSGRHPERFAGAVNPPVFHASTILSATVAEFEDKKVRRARDEVGTYYGLPGTPTMHALEEALAELEGAHRACIFPSGLAACTGPLMAYLAAGDHLLVPDSVYGPTRAFCDGFLTRFGVAVQYYDPCIGAGIAGLMQKNTRVVFTESPGSHTFEVQDIPAIVEAAHRAGALVLMDNTWASPIYFDALGHGVDVSIQATTKYINGHSDVILGSVVATKAAWPQLRDLHRQVGFTAGPDDIYSALRGLRTLHVRMPHHWQSGLRLAEWFKAQPEVARVMHPALPDDPGHALWKRDFTGASGLFGVALAANVPRAALEAFIDALELFGLGASWGGFESLVMITDVKRTATRWSPPGPVFRVHAGLEAVDDLVADLEAGFAALRARL